MEPVYNVQYLIVNFVILQMSVKLASQGTLSLAEHVSNALSKTANSAPLLMSATLVLQDIHL